MCPPLYCPSALSLLSAGSPMRRSSHDQQVHPGLTSNTRRRRSSGPRHSPVDQSGILDAEQRARLPPPERTGARRLGARSPCFATREGIGPGSGRVASWLAGKCGDERQYHTSQGSASGLISHTSLSWMPRCFVRATSPSLRLPGLTLPTMMTAKVHAATNLSSAMPDEAASYRK